MKIDLRFVDIFYEQAVLAECIRMLDNSATELVNIERRRVWSVVAESGTEESLAEGAHLDDLLESGIATRHLTGALLVALWAAFESAVKTISFHARRSGFVTQPIPDTRQSLLIRARKYFRDELCLELCVDELEYNRLDQLRVLRNAVAHGNGQLVQVGKNDQERLRKWTLEVSGLSLVDDSLIVSTKFLVSTGEFMDRFTKELVNRFKASTAKAVAV